MKKLFIVTGSLTLIVLVAIFSVMPYYSIAKGKWKQPCLKTARNFILNDFHDFVPTGELRTRNLSKDSDTLRQFMKDKREMNRYRCETVGRKAVLKKAKVEDEKFIDNGDGTYDVIVSLDLTFDDGKERASINDDYKVHMIIENGQPKVQAAMSNDTSASWLIDGENGIKSDQLDYSWQLPGKKNKKASAPYDLEKAKKELKADLQAPPWPGGKDEM